ncbi:MAG: DUF2892 domain-containing protein [archaeon]
MCSCTCLKRNEGETDRMVRALASGVFLIAGFFFLEEGLQTIAYVISAILATTAIIGFCPLYAVLGINTGPAEKPKTIAAQKKRRRK